MVVGSTSLQLVSVLDESITEGTGVGNDLLGIDLELWLSDLVQGSGDGSDSLNKPMNKHGVDLHG